MNMPATDGGFTLPDPSGINDRTLPFFDLPDVNPAERSVLFFRVDPINTPVTLTVILNGNTIVQAPFSTTPERSWHELIKPDILLATNNEMIIGVGPVGPVGPVGSIEISDGFIVYQADV